jgi:Concanavalin A-like lectin/glucanases superfamily
MKNLILFLALCSYTAQAQITSYNNAARNTFYGIGGYSFSQTSFPNGVQANPYVVSGPSPQNDFSFAVLAVGGITNRIGFVSTNASNTSISIKCNGNNIRKFGCFVLPLRASNINLTTNDVIRVTATTNLGNVATQTGGVQIGQFVGFSVINPDEYIVSIDAQFENTPSPAAFLTLPSIMVGDNTPQNVALHFDGVDDYVSIPSTVGNFSTSQDFTVTCWIKPDVLQPAPTGENDIISKWAGLGAGVNNNYPFVIRYLNQNLADVNLRGKILVGQWDGTNFPTIVSTTAVNDGRWHHVAFVKTGTLLKLYIDGEQEGGNVTDNATNATTNTTPLQFGRRGNNENHFKGEIDEVRIIGTAKTPTEIQNERFCKNPDSNFEVARYSFSNGVPHDNNALITQVQDGISTNHGTLNNFAKTGDASNFVTGQVKYVKNNATGNFTGSSWTNAIIDLQNAVFAYPCNDLFDVYVAKGNATYKPSITNNVSESFIIPSGMSIYGGFAGTEKSINQRNRALIQTTNETTLSGDLSGNDILSDFTQNRSDNSKTVVNIGGKSNIIIEGFSIRGGFGGSYGGGILSNSSENIRINHCKIFDNSATFGGGIAASNANNLLIINTYLLGNRATANGHAIYFISFNGTKNLKLNNCVVAGHTGDAIFAIAMDFDESPFGIINHSYTNCTFANNGTAISNEANGGTNNFTLKNSIIYGNTTGISVFNLDGSYNQNITYSLVQGETSTANGNLNGNTTNPQFVILPIPAVVPSTGGDFRLKDSSPCINTGTDAGVSPFDLERNLRPKGGKTDMGAFESNVNMNEIISKATGNWETTTTWNLDRLPLPTDKVILNGHQVTVTTNAARAKDLEYKTGAILRYLSGGVLRFGL